MGGTTELAVLAQPLRVGPVRHDFSNFRIFRSVAWMRLTWLAALAGVWTVSWLCVRQYGKGVLGSLARSVRRLYRPAIALALLACAGAAYAAQPFIDRATRI